MVQATVPTSSRFDTDVEHAHVSIYETVHTRSVSWGAITAGAVAAIAIMMLLAVMGTAIGLSVLAGLDDTPGAGLSIGGALYWLISGLIALFIGGWMAGRLRNTPDSSLGACHGFLAWCAVTVFSIAMLALAGGNMLGGSLAGAGNLLATEQTTSSPARSNDISSFDADRNSNRVASENRTIDEQQARDAAQSAAGASWWTFFGLVLGAGVTSLGGMMAARSYRDNDEDRNDRQTNVTSPRIHE